MEVIGISRIGRGDLIELSIGMSLSKGESISEQAQNLLKRMKSRNAKPTNKELAEFVSLVSEIDNRASDDDDYDD